MTEFDLQSHAISVRHVFRNLAPSSLYEEAILHERGTTMSNTGALIAYSGEKTGRSPEDKRIVRNPESEADVRRGPVNYPLDNLTFSINRERAIDFLNTCPRLYCVDAFAGWDPRFRIKVRVVCARPYHALFMHNMLIRPTDQELADFGSPDLVIYNAGAFPANRFTTGMTSKTSVDLNLETKEVVILGTEYAGEMKKAVFTYLNYVMPKVGILSMHCSATVDSQLHSSAVLFGLSGTGKTTLSADPARQLIGDDEHCWTDDGVFNIEGGCYAKAVFLSREAEPQIFDALRFGAVLENVIYDQAHHHVDFSNTSITDNTRGAYPIEHIANARIPCLAPHPTDVIFLTCDAFGVMPPLSRLSPAQAEYYFISGYTAKVAGTEMGVKEPQATFSPCFGGPFLVWHPAKYADLLAQRLGRHQSQVWLINTGWTGGPFGVGRRINLSHTRAMLGEIYKRNLTDAPTETDPVFGLETVTACQGVPSAILRPRTTWSDPANYDQSAQRLKRLFETNFQQYANGVRREVQTAGARS